MGMCIKTCRCHYIKPVATFRHNGVAWTIFPSYPVTWEAEWEARTGDTSGFTSLCLDLTPDVYEENMTGVRRILEISDSVVD